MSIGDTHDLILAVASLVDKNKFDQNIEDFEEAKKMAIDLCAPGAGLEILAGSIDEEDVKKAAEKDHETMRKDLESFMPLIDPDRLQKMVPPMFCGPCKPWQVGQKPVMAQQTHPTQLFMFNKANRDAYKMVDEIFNNNLSVYKDIIFETGKDQLSFQSAMGAGVPNSGEEDSGYAGYIKRLEDYAKKQDDNAEDPANQIVANNLREAIKTAANPEAKNLYVFKSSETQYHSHTGEQETIKGPYAEFKYDIAGTTFVMYIIYNFSDETVVLSDYHLKDAAGNPVENMGLVHTPPKQIKLAIIDTTTQMVDLEFPNPEVQGARKHTIANFDLNDLKPEFAKYWENNPKNVSPAFAEIIKGTNDDFFKSLFPIASSYIFETVFVQGTHLDLFEAKNFRKLPLTNSEAKESCDGDAGITPLLDPEGVLDNVDKARQSLECIIGMFDKPDAIQTSNIYGLYNLMIRVCVIEEYLKNIFAFGFIKISDILETPAYMNYMIDSLKDVVDSSLAIDGYENLLNYSQQIIKGRQQLGDIDEEDLTKQKGDTTLTRLPTRTECLEILIKETAEQVNDIFDTRIQNLIDPEWKNKFVPYKDMVAGKTDFVGRILEYAAIGDYWDAPLIPLPGPGPRAPRHHRGAAFTTNATFL